MDSVRKIEKIWSSHPTLEGAGVHLNRAFGFPYMAQMDPFLLLDDFRSDDPGKYLKGFPWHPHRGIETITYMLEGTVEHADSMGNTGVIGPGDVQWMTAGSGIIHQEMPQGDAKGRMGGFQLWANLPASHKMMDPRYREIKRDTIPVTELPGGVTVRVIAGKAGDVEGPVRDIVTDPEYLDVSVPAGAAFRHPVRHGHTVFAYVVEGAGSFEFPASAPGREDLGRAGQVVLLKGRGELVAVKAETGAVRFLLLSGKPLKEPVAWHGPIVMNTPEELETAFEEYRNGKFIKI